MAADETYTTITSWANTDPAASSSECTALCGSRYFVRLTETLLLARLHSSLVVMSWSAARWARAVGWLLSPWEER